MKVFVIAGEPSGDKLGAALMRGLKSTTQEPVDFQGVGGEGMIAEGLNSLFPMSEIAIMGIGAILREYRNLKRRIRETANTIIAEKPDVLVTIDLPEFCLRVAELVKAESDIRVVHYVAPTVWAWRPKRAQKMARHVDQVLALFPFEPPYMEAAGMRCDFVGHPVVTEQVATEEEIAAFKTAHGFGDAPVVLVLPGSRRSEIGRLAGTFGETLGRIAESRPDIRFVLPAAGNVADLVEEAVQNWPVNVTVLDPRGVDAEKFATTKRAAFGAADVALAASGTVALELAAAQTPMVIAYDMPWLSRQIIGRMLLVDTVNLVSLVSDTREIPEFIGKDCQANLIAPAVLSVLDDPSRQTKAMAVTMERLGQGGPPPGERAALAVLDGLK